MDSNEKITEALKLLEDAARQKKDELRTALSDRYTHLRGLIVETEESVRKSLVSATDHAREAAGHARDVGVEKSRELACNVDKSVHQSPWPYIAGAAVVGVFLGYVLGRDRR